METLRDRNEIELQYKWDLSTIFASDAAWAEAFQPCESLIEKACSYQGTLTDAPTIKEYLDTYMELTGQVQDILTYASLRHSEDTRATDAKEMHGKAFSLYIKAMGATAFGEPEILSLPQELLEAIASDECLREYAFFLHNIIRRKKHMLTAREEELLARFGEAFNAAAEIAESLRDSDMVFESILDGEGNTRELNNASYILMQGSRDRVLRKNSFKSYYKSYIGHINTLASAYGAYIKKSVTEAKARGYASSREMAMDLENIPVSVYDSLIEIVHSHMDLMHRYVALRKRILGLDELHYYDIYAPLSQGIGRKYTYEEAQQMILEALRPLGEEYEETVRMAFQDRWIDVFPNKGKSSGAFSSGTYGSNPVIMCNFTGTLDSVSMIAHEMGHSMHSWMTHRSQPIQYSDYTAFVAEVASTVNENLLIEQLLSKETDPRARLMFLNQYLEGFKGTVYRQTMFAEFEKEAHAMAERGEIITPDALNKLYEGLIRQYFGSGLALDDEVKYEWARIPHFFYQFYVYVYATGYCSAVAISEKVLKEKEPAVKKYLEFLSMGGSRHALDELAHAGVDLRTTEPLEIALHKFEKVLDDAERTAASLGL